MNSITPCLWFDGDAEEAVEFYLGIFPDSGIAQVTRYPEGGERGGTALTVSFKLRGMDYVALNGGPAYSFNEAVSLMVLCDTQEEIDHYWSKLGDGGSEMACGWLKDRYGLAWQIVPAEFFGMIDAGDPARAARALAAMNTMVKFDLAALRTACEAPA